MERTMTESARGLMQLITARTTQSGCTMYDTCGANKAVNPGSYRFKAGLAGRSAKESAYIGQFEACENVRSYAIARMGQFARNNYRRLSAAIKTRNLPLQRS